MTRLALYPYLVAGASLGVAYFDLYFLLVGASAVLWSLSEETAAAVRGPATVSARGARALRSGVRVLEEVRPVLRRPGRA